MLKKIRNVFSVLTIGISVLSMVSCLDDNEVTYPPVKLEDIPGTYNGKIAILYNNLTKEELINNVVTTDSMKIAKFPMNEIINSFEKDEEKANEILTQLTPVKYDFAYTANIKQEYGGAEMILNPEPLTLNINTDEGVKSAVIKFSAKENGFYSTVEKAMAIRLKVDEIIYDGEKVELEKGITYTMPYLTKK